MTHERLYIKPDGSLNKQALEVDIESGATLQVIEAPVTMNAPFLVRRAGARPWRLRFFAASGGRFFASNVCLRLDELSTCYGAPYPPFSGRCLPAESA